MEGWPSPVYGAGLENLLRSNPLASSNLAPSAIDIYIWICYNGIGQNGDFRRLKKAQKEALIVGKNPKMAENHIFYQEGKRMTGPGDGR